MTPAEIKKTKLYRTLAPCVRKEDREELARMLAMVPTSAFRGGHKGFDDKSLYTAFAWHGTPQGFEYWESLFNSLRAAGHGCW